MGALPVLIALVVGEGPISTYASRALLVAVLLLVVNPAASHALARAAYKTGVPMWRGAVRDDVRPREAPGGQASSVPKPGVARSPADGTSDGEPGGDRP
jgi:multicomponent Na+:H+ antiporter subunit G